MSTDKNQRGGAGARTMMTKGPQPKLRAVCTRCHTWFLSPASNPSKVCKECKYREYHRELYHKKKKEIEEEGD